MELEEGENVLCTVLGIDRTTVFVKIEDNGEGTIVTSEIAPGRIRNLREYVVPNKKIACKILKIENNNINLSLRRVTSKERKEVLEKYEREKSSLNILKSVLKEGAEEIVKKIKKSEANLFEFLQSCKENPKKLEKYISTEDAEKIWKILSEKKEKEKELKKDFSLTSNSPEGITKIKKILSVYENITYISAGKFLIKVKAANYKKANQELDRILEEIKEKAKKENCKFEFKEK